MKIAITPSDAEIFEIDWPDQWRIPVAGEWILIGAYQYRVDAVQWEFDQGSSEPVIQLRVTEDS